MHENEVRNKFRKLVQQLISNTENGKIVWHDTADEDAFRANMQGGMVRVQKRFRFDEEGHEKAIIPLHRFCPLNLVTLVSILMDQRTISPLASAPPRSI